MHFLYPSDLKSKPMMWLWELKDVAILGVMAIFSVFAIAQTEIFIPLVITALYGFLSIQYEGVSILGFIKYVITFLFAKQQIYDWQA